MTYLLNAFLILVIAILTNALFDDELFAENKHSLTALERQAACYSRLLGIPTPKIINHPYRLKTSFGNVYGNTRISYTGKIVVRLYKGHPPQTNAHEQRHAWQYSQGWPDELETPYNQRKNEIDARNWAANNYRRCPLTRSY